MSDHPAAPSTRSPLSRLRSVVSEPLVHFAIGAAILLAAQHFFARPEISVSPQLLNGLCKDFEARAQRVPTSTEIDRLEQEYIEDEVLYREALRTGLAQDNRVRSVLLQTMRNALRPLLDEPTDAELEALRREAPEAYRYPEKLSFAHVSYTRESEVPPGLLERLRADASPVAGTLTKLPSPMPPTDRKQLGWIFGEEFSAAVAGCEAEVWSGPFASRRGVHFVRLLAREPSAEMPLAEIRPKLTALWISRKESAEISGKAAEMRKAYRIKLAPRKAAAP